jgi:uncharacterized protein YcaQ
LPASLDDLRRYAVARSLFAPTSLARAVARLGFVQADPIRAPARAQDLILRHRVSGYRAGDLERRYASLDVEEDFFVNYGFLPRRYQRLMHPRAERGAWTAASRRHAGLLLAFVRERGACHPRVVDEHFAHGSVTNYWGGSSSATTHLLDKMHYHGLLRVVRREAGIRIYAVPVDGADAYVAPPAADTLDALIDLAVHVYAPVPAATLAWLSARMRYAAPHLGGGIRAALQRAKSRLAHTRIEGIEWYWPAGERAAGHAVDPVVRLLAPFDPVVWDRRRFEAFWGWAYRFEAYTPVAKRVRGYYALPLLWRDRVIGWGNLSVVNGVLRSDIGYAGARPRDAAFRRELEAELERVRAFLRLGAG